MKAILLSTLALLTASFLPKASAISITFNGKFEFHNLRIIPDHGTVEATLVDITDIHLAESATVTFQPNQWVDGYLSSVSASIKYRFIVHPDDPSLAGQEVPILIAFDAFGAFSSNPSLIPTEASFFGEIGFNFYYDRVRKTDGSPMGFPLDIIHENTGYFYNRDAYQNIDIHGYPSVTAYDREYEVDVYARMTGGFFVGGEFIDHLTIPETIPVWLSPCALGGILVLRCLRRTSEEK